MDIILETDRLLLRKFTLEDASLIFELNKDPEVTRYTHDPMTDVIQARQVLEQVILPQYNLYDHGRLAAHLKDGLDFIGWCGLKYIPERKEIDLGYRFSRTHWGNGYATEAAMACIRHGFQNLGVQQIVGRALPENTASIRVLEKCGLVYRGEEHVDGFLLKTYVINNQSSANKTFTPG